MIKVNYIALASLAAAIMAVSCSKEKMQSQSPSESTVLKANIVESPETKTNIGSAAEGTSANVVWTAGDKLTVLNGKSYVIASEFTLTGGANTSSGTFSFSGSIGGNVMAIYPYATSGISYDSDNDKILLEIPQTQAYTDASFAQGSVPMVAYGDIDSPLTFNYLFSVMAFKIQRLNKSVDKVTVSATKPLWGPAEITDYGTASPVITLTGTDSKYRTVELNCATAQDITFDKVFYIAVPAGTYSYAVNVYCGTEVYHQIYSIARTFTAGSIKYNSTAKTFTDNGPAYVDGDYIGEGIRIGSTWWAPVNCGYDAIDSPMGLLYQWGRKYGQAYESGTIVPTAMAKSDDTETYGHLFGLYNSSDFNWFSGGVDNTLWNGSSRGTSDPCPNGWRVPAYEEMNALVGGNQSGWTDAGGNKGFYFNGTSSCTASSAGDKLYLPAASYRLYNDGSVDTSHSYGYYWTSSAYDNTVWRLFFYIDNAINGLSGRAYGYSVRCVQQ